MSEHVILSVIIVNYKTPDLVIRCINSIYKTFSLNSLEIIVIDNCSGDDSENKTCTLFPKIIWINNNSNEGFGRANNLGASKAKADFLLFLNSDMIVLDDTINDCLRHIQEESNIGVLGCKLMNEDGSHQKSIYHYVGDYMGVLQTNLIVDYFYKSKAKEIKAVMGAFMLIPKKVFDEAKGFDPDFFMYAEELDLCRRIKKLGYKITYTEKAIAIHKHGGSSEGSNWSFRQNFLSNALLYLKVRGYVGYFIYHFLMTSTFLMNLALLWKMNKKYRIDFWKIHSYYFSNFVNYIKIPFLYSKLIGNGKRILKAN